MTSPRKPLVLLVVSLTVALVAGCGNGGSSSSGERQATASREPPASTEGGGDGGSGENPLETSSLTKAEYVKKARRLCIHSKESISEAQITYLQKHRGGDESERFVAGIEKVIVPGREEMIAELRELGAPAGDEQQVEAMLAALEDVVVASADLEGPDPTPEFARKAKRATRLTREYGLFVCSYV